MRDSGIILATTLNRFDLIFVVKSRAKPLFKNYAIVHLLTRVKSKW